jgi:hypothetical protein
MRSVPEVVCDQLKLLAFAGVQLDAASKAIGVAASAGAGDRAEKARESVTASEMTRTATIASGIARARPHA